MSATQSQEEMGDQTRSRWRREWPRGAAFAAVLLAALWPRLSSLRVLFARGELMQWDGDSAYHLKRIFYAIAHFPRLPRFDAAMNWPAGAPCPWPDGFDLLAAGWGLVAGHGDPARATMAALLFTPILALLVIWAAIDLARQVIPEGPAREGAALAAGLLTSVVPSAIFQSQVGFLDHHIAELLAFLLLAGWALRRLPRSSAPAETPGLRWELGGALAATFALWVFAGGVLYVAISVAIVLVALLRAERPRVVGSGVLALTTAAAAVFLLTLPSLSSHGRVFSYQFPSLVQPLLVAGGAAALALAVAVARLARGPAKRTAILAALGLAGAGAAALAFPSAFHEVRAGLEGWLLRRDPWIASVAEFQPFGQHQQSLLLALYANFGAIGVGAPLILLAGGWAAIRGTGARGVAFTLLSAGFVFLTLRQVRFERIGQPLLMINTACALAAFAHRKRVSANRAAAMAFPALATLALIFSDPMLRLVLAPQRNRIPPIAHVALNLRDQVAGQPETGVVTAWDQGHLASVLSGLPTPTNGFGSYLDAATFAETEQVFARDGDAIDAFLERHRSRFIVAGAITNSLFTVHGRFPFVLAQDTKGGVLDLDYMRAFGASPLVIGGSAIPGANVKQLERLMPIYATREQPVGLAFPLPALWTFERVAGARLEGRAPPGKRVIASLDFKEQGRPHVWRGYADADASGAFALVTPLPTSLARYALATGPRYSLRVDDGPPVEVAVTEQSVRDGAILQVGAVRPGAAPPDATGSLSEKRAPPDSALVTRIPLPKDSTIP